MFRKTPPRARHRPTVGGVVRIASSVQASPWSITQVDGHAVAHKRDQRNSITSALGLTRYGGRLAGVVESPKAKDQVSALLDLMDLQQHGGEDPSEGVALLLASELPRV